MTSKVGRPKRFKESQIGDALRLGHNRTSGADFGCDRRTISRAVESSAVLQATKAEADENILDMAECAIVNAAANGDTGAAKFILSTKGKKRGSARDGAEETQPIVIKLDGVLARL